ncbi:hypothetical protein [Xenorhabdus bovienii]|uniref:Putative membrane protein n=2 Tax=Xenorhabdus bovienii TaxID=40576 RepID=A0A077PLJ1_XENBV|nr:hypothetical protein [Xenorhabdus bovienii]CDH34592.1 putative membrane protein [Xenorhabdus bovienii str. Intermedium]MDE1486183.1 hypothetical protein [Xenorhabdus bovienii]MDE9432142.1 hypothetical protein [Xenorhabdus bovienii]MDE9436444.1 hypothetical protein [Xenorhabdus bovienii]MDE9446318.1 hypothetical protein [Xenorhabdus bovienii]
MGLDRVKVDKLKNKDITALLSKYAMKKQDEQTLASLKQLDNRAVLGFFAIALILGMIGGKKLARSVLVLWPLYSVIYIVMFRKLSQRLHDSGLRSLVNFGNSYPFYQFCWVVIIFAMFFLFLFFMHLIML